MASKGSAIRHELRWLNCVSVDVTPEQALALASLECVTNIDLVEQYVAKKDDAEGIPGAAPLFKQASPLVDSLNYGASLGQDTLIKVHRVHNNRIFGQGVILAQFDGGFSN